MPARYKEVAYEAPLAGGLANQAWIAPSDSPWRLVIFPGTPARKYLFERMLRRAPDDLEVVLLARPGFGRGHSRAYIDFSEQVAAARPFLETEKQVVTLGVSYGGELALKAALDFPQTVRGIVTVAALITEPRAYVQRFVDLGGAPLVRAVLPRTLHHARAEVAGRRAQIGPLLDRLRDLKVPVSILHGDRDHLVALRDAHALKACFAPGADVEIERIEGGVHFLELQAPERVYAAVNRIIARAGSAAKNAHDSKDNGK